MDVTPGPVALTIAGSDPSGGAGIQADLATFAAFGIHGASVVTALTAQNTRGVHAVTPVAAEFVRTQLDAVLDDLAVTAAKTGMLHDARDLHELVAPRIAHESVHGTGCVLSAAITADLALGHDLHDAVSAAKRFVTGAIERARPFGRGARLLDLRRHER